MRQEHRQGPTGHDEQRALHSRASGGHRGLEQREMGAALCFKICLVWQCKIWVRLEKVLFCNLILFYILQHLA